MVIGPGIATPAAERTWTCPVCSSLSALWQMKVKSVEISADLLLMLSTEIYKDQV